MSTFRRNLSLCPIWRDVHETIPRDPIDEGRGRTKHAVRGYVQHQRRSIAIGPSHSLASRVRLKGSGRLLALRQPLTRFLRGDRGAPERQRP